MTTTHQTQREQFTRWHAEFMRAVDARTAHASRHLNQPKNAEVEARAVVVQTAKRRLAPQLVKTEWFGEWLRELMVMADDLAAAARQYPLDSPAVAKARQLVEHRARQIPGDSSSSIDYQYISVVYRLAPEDSLSEILDHPCRYSHSTGNINVTLNKARSDLARAESQLKERDRTYLEQEHSNHLLQSHLSEATKLLQTILLRGQASMPAEDIESIHDFFKLSNAGNAD